MQKLSAGKWRALCRQHGISSGIAYRKRWQRRRKESAQFGRLLSPQACTGGAASPGMGSIKPPAKLGAWLLAVTGYRQRFHAWVRCVAYFNGARACAHRAGGEGDREGALGVSVERARTRSESTRHNGKIAASSDDWIERRREIVAESNGLSGAGGTNGLRRAECQRCGSEGQRQHGSTSHIENLLADGGGVGKDDRSVNCPACPQGGGKGNAERTAASGQEHEAGGA